jgi:uncharacterized protein YdaU (DUF1376 family)
MRRPMAWTRFSYEDFFSDPAVVCMSNEEVGAYMRLLYAAHRAKRPGVLPDEDRYLSTICMWKTEEWLSHRPIMIKAWLVKNGLWIQRRIVREHALAKKVAETRSRNGHKGAELRWPGYSQPMQDLDSRQRKRRILDSKTLESEPAFSQKAQVNGLVKGLSTHLNGKAP